MRIDEILIFFCSFLQYVRYGFYFKHFTYVAIELYLVKLIFPQKDQNCFLKVSSRVRLITLIITDYKMT